MFPQGETETTSFRLMTIVLSFHCSDKEERAGEGEIVCERI